MGTLRILKCGLMWGMLGVLFPFALLGVGIGTAESQGPPDPQDALHEVLPGDNLHLIAGYYYGDCRQWERIWEANRKPVRNPNLLERGIVLRIPDVTIPDESYTDFVARVRRSPDPAGAPLSPSVRP
jgi:hypothetical protein